MQKWIVVVSNGDLVADPVLYGGGQRLSLATSQRLVNVVDGALEGVVDKVRLLIALRFAHRYADLVGDETVERLIFS